MKAFVVERYGEDGLRAADVPEPDVGDGDVPVKVSDTSLNPLDKMVRNGEFKQLLKYRTPFVLGHDVAGVVTRVGSAVRHFQVGDEVAGPRRPRPSETWPEGPRPRRLRRPRVDRHPTRQAPRRGRRHGLQEGGLRRGPLRLRTSCWTR
jgi:hypothetical protein